VSIFDTKPWLDAYAPGVPHEIALPSGSLVDMVEDAVTRFRRTTALQFFGEPTSYAELGDQIGRAAEGLRRLGVGKGDRVAIVLPNCPQHVVAFYAILRLGAVVVEHNPLYTARELRHQFEDHGARVVIAWDKVAGLITDFPKDLPIDAVVSVDVTRAMPFGTRVALRLPVAKARTSRKALTTASRVRGTSPWEALISHGSLRRKHPRPDGADLALLQYTSGTTGNPKGVMLSHSNLLANAAQGRAWVPGLSEGGEIFYAVLPLFHAYGMTLCLTFAMNIGATVVLFPKFDVDLVLTAFSKTPATFLPAVPPIYEALARAAEQRKMDLSGIRFAISGAMSLPVSIVRRWEHATGGLLVEGYGMTETSPVALGNPMGPTRRPGTVGVPFPNTEIRVVDPADPTVDLGPGEAGELLIRGPQVFSGYWKRPEDTAAALIGDGWLRTGDIVEVSADGFVTVVDRVKELIVTGGFNVSPSEVEHVLMDHPDVREAAVIGLPRESGGEDVAAAVVMQDGTMFDQNALRDFCRRALTPYKIPKRIVQVDELPRSLIGKVLRKDVRERMIAD
jgi:long-chain acyl-CoA synthetase